MNIEECSEAMGRRQIVIVKNSGDENNNILNDFYVIGGLSHQSETCDLYGLNCEWYGKVLIKSLELFNLKLYTSEMFKNFSISDLQVLKAESYGRNPKTHQLVSIELQQRIEAIEYSIPDALFPLR